MVRAEFQTLAKLANKIRWSFQLFSIFFSFFFGNSIGWFNHHLEMISIRSIHQEFQFCWAYTRSIFSYIFPKYKLTSNKSCFPNHCRMCPGVRVVLWVEGISNLYIQKTLPPPENNIPWFPLKKWVPFQHTFVSFSRGSLPFPLTTNFRKSPRSRGRNGHGNDEAKGWKRPRRIGQTTLEKPPENY